MSVAPIWMQLAAALSIRDFVRARELLELMKKRNTERLPCAEAR